MTKIKPKNSFKLRIKIKKNKMNLIKKLNRNLDTYNNNWKKNKKIIKNFSIKFRVYKTNLQINKSLIMKFINFQIPFNKKTSNHLILELTNFRFNNLINIKPLQQINLYRTPNSYLIIKTHRTKHMS